MQTSSIQAKKQLIPKNVELSLKAQAKKLPCQTLFCCRQHQKQIRLLIYLKKKEEVSWGEEGFQKMGLNELVANFL